MLFSSLSFLLYFLPPVLLIHYFLPKKAQNIFLFFASLLFYAWGDAKYVPLFFALLAVDWLCGMGIEKTEKPWGRKALLIVGVVANMGALALYKYMGFFSGLLGNSQALSWLIVDRLPLGISFFTFQATGYLVDVYRKQTKSERNLFAFGTFIFMFPQLIAGPIVRYSDLSKALHEKRRPGARALETGMALFVGGLSAKVLLANPLGALAQEMKPLMQGDTLAAWLYMLSYSFQIYFDFMGYSVMAVGMGRMLGFTFPRNFNHPYAASSVTDFWRRWHMTLSGWFRDYVYIPLGGSRKGTARTVLNLFIVWSLTGFWHGADWNFILWGVWYFAMLMADKYLFPRVKGEKLLRRAWGYLSIGIGWIIFSCNIGEILPALSSLVSFRFQAQTLFWLREYALVMLAAAACCVPWIIEKGKAMLLRHGALRFITVMGALLLCLAALAKSTYNPFLYFHF